MPPKRVVLFRASAPPYQPKPQPTADEHSDEEQQAQEIAAPGTVKVIKKVTPVSQAAATTGSTLSLQDDLRRHVQRVVLNRVASTGPITAQPLSRTSTLTLATAAGTAAATASTAPSATAAKTRVVQLRRAHTATAVAPTGLRLLRTNSAMAAPKVAPQAAAFAPPNRPLAAAPQEDSSFASQLRTFLAVLNLSAKESAGLKWIDESGACDMGELMENLPDFAEALDLTEEERCRLKGGARTAAHAARLQSSGALKVRSTLTPAVSVPVTVQERKHTQQRLLLSLVPKPLPEEEEEEEEDEEEKDGEEDEEQQKEVAEHGNRASELDEQEHHEDGVADLDRHTQAVLTTDNDEDLIGGRGRSRALKRLPPHRRMRWWTPPRHRWRVDDKILRARIPEESELKAVEIAKQKAKEAVEREWADVLAELAAKEAAKKSSGRRPRKGEEGYDDSRFGELRRAFLEKYKATILSELPSDIELVPADISQKVKDKFLSAVGSSSCEPTFGYHGTKSRNIPAILEDGLLVPGTKHVRVANGSAHGVGIYTALPGASGLSQGFCDTPSSMLICGVVDPNATKVPLVREETNDSDNVTPAATPAKFVNGHKQTRKAVAKAKPVINRNAGFLNWPSESREEPDLRVAGAARIFFKDSLVAPLFVAVQKGSDAPRRSGISTDNSISFNSNNSSDPTQSTRGKVIIRESGEEVWAPPQPYTCWNARRVKRILVKKEHDKDLKDARALKKELLKTHGVEDD